MKEEKHERPPLTAEQFADLQAVQGIEPNTADIPEAPAANWQHARKFYRPRKEAISLRLDADVLDWLRSQHKRYQPEINRILRERMEADRISHQPSETRI
jgi:uncharacterized protein (DUF4415 family)